MATTRIMPLHVGKGRTESRAISDIIDYVANPKKTDNGRLITGYACDNRTADAEFLLAKRQYIAATGRVRGADDVISYHVRQSFHPGEITPEEANRLGVEFAKRFTKGNHAFVVCTHIDKSHMYAVVLIWFYVVMHTEGSFDCLLLGGLLPPIKGCFLNMIPVFIQTERQIWLLAAALEIVLFHSDLIIVQRLY